MPTKQQYLALAAVFLDDNAPDESIQPSELLGIISDVYDYVDQQAGAVPAGPQGIQGPAGPIGPAGLNWQGAWAATTNYVMDDAVGYSGASYFCIQGLTGNAGNTNPAADATHWALLAAQGAQGIQGPAGAQGVKGDAGAQGPAGSSALEYSVQLFQSGTGAPLPQAPQVDTISSGFSSSDPNYREVLFARTGVGTYTARVAYKTSGFVNPDKVALMFGDAVARVTAVASGGSGGLFYKQFTFKTYTPEGVAADGLLLGNSGGYLTIKIYN